MRKSFLLSMCIAFITLNVNAQTVFDDAYAPGVSFAPFGGSTNDVTIDATEFNSGSASLKILVTSGYTGGAFANATAQNLSGYNCVSFYVKASKAATLNVTGLGNNGVSNPLQTEYNNVALTTSWVKVIIPIPDPAKLTAETGMFHFAEGSDEGAYTIWLDDIKYENLSSSIIGTPTAAFATETIAKGIGDNFSPNGATCSFPVNSVTQNLSISKLYFTFSSSNTAVATFNNATGTGTVVGSGSANITAVLGTTPASGVLTVNVLSVTEPTTAAPTPTVLPANVISFYSNAYTNVTVDTWSAPWDAADVADVLVATNDTKKYTNLNYCGIEFTSAPVDATNMDNYHVDVWTPNAGFFNIKLVDFGANGVYGGGDDSESELPFTPAVSGWVSIDIPLSNFTGLASRAHLAQMLFVSNNSTVFVDNLYLYKVVVIPTDPTTAAPTPTPLAANVISLFSNAYTNVTVDTWSAGWDAADVEDVQVAGNDTKKYTNLNYSGIEFTSSPIDATNMETYHVDIWTPNAGFFNIKLVDFGANGSYGGGDDSESELGFNPSLSGWVSLDIPLSNFTGLASRAHLAQMLFVSNNSKVYVDNVYFYKAPSVCCAAPTNLNATVKSSTTVKFSFTASTCGSGLTYRARVRPINTSVWKYGSRATTQVLLTGFAPATTYQWEVATVCQKSPLLLSSYTAGPNFTTTAAIQNEFTENSNLKSSSDLSATIFPNPAVNAAILSITNSGSVNIKITDLSGKSLWQSLNVKGQQIKLPIENLASGIYLVSVTNGEETKVLKLVKQ